MRKIIGSLLMAATLVEAFAIGVTHYLSWWETLGFTFLGIVQVFAGYWFADFDGLTKFVKDQTK